MGKITKKSRFRELYTDHFQNAQKETKTWKPDINKEQEREHRKISKFKDVVEFIDLKMETAVRPSYDRTKSLDENIEEFKCQKKLQDESD